MPPCRATRSRAGSAIASHLSWPERNRTMSDVAVRLDSMQTAPETSAPWRDVFGQEAAVEQLRAAVRDPGQMTHAWLITGPPGSGRSTIAYAFAAALIAE